MSRAGYEKVLLGMMIIWLLVMLKDRTRQARGIADFQRRVFRSKASDEFIERGLTLALIVMIAMGILALAGIL